MSVHSKLAAMQMSLAVEKGQVNTYSQTNFKYRNAEDILKALKPLLDGLTIVIESNIVVFGDRYYVEATALLSDGEASISAKGYAREALIKKGMDEAQVTGAATSYAKKYALGNLFAIDNEKDSDSQDHTVAPLPILTVRDKADWAKAVAIYKRYGDLKMVEESRQITPEVNAAIISQAQSEQYAEDAAADNKTLEQGV